MNETILHRVLNETWRYSHSCGTLNPTESRSTSVQVYDGNRSGSQNPFWRDQVRSGRNATTNYSRTGYIVNKAVPVTYEFSAKCSPGSVNKGKSLFKGSILSYPVTSDFNAAPPSNLTSASNMAIMNLIHDAKAQYNHISGGVFLGELRETLNMIRNPARALRAQSKKYLDYLSARKGTYRNKRDAENFLSSSWLEVSFGWLPLIADTKSGAEALSRLIHGDVRFAHAKGFGKYEATSQPAVGNFNVPNFLLGTRTTSVLTRDTVIINAGVNAKASGPTLDNAMQLFGFTPEEFVPTVYNLLPWTFLIDYFVNIGDVLEATFFDRSGISWTSRTELTEKVYRSNVSHRTQIPGWEGNSKGGSYMVTKKTMNRLSSTPLVPSMEISLPGSPQKWINMGALLAQHKSLVPFHLN